ncbi:ArnT family glycosyltransferase [Leptospira haakeii]|uniref:Glycosyltransferase RgtA/B/C/D-like domain-containing protein n=1 Tax=Leptospira haakeii TaxID=2023198 RepID=A0ABX4PKE7_9LEPT|nr:hypothetical protein [Leptospira haakeii]PKA16257.1 hypothetical protein CH363_08995 [Leptospira haakeii]PKA19860.1 hypothetical protein CH377_10850 [Leptospira haakeii]
MTSSWAQSRIDFLKEKLIRTNTTIESWNPSFSNILIPSSILIFGFFYNLYFALIGFQPLDGSIVFDGGWRILNGQIPFKDFSAPAGTTPSLIQAFLFSIFGVNWISYLIHSSLFNGLLGAISYIWFRKEGGNVLLSTLLAFLSVILFYPPVGFPFIETHSFFFSVLALFLTSLAVQNVRLIYIVAIFVSFFLGFLSKQIPAALLIFGIPVLMIRLQRKDIKKFLLYSIVTIIGISLFVLLINLIFGIDWREEFFYLFQITLGTGQDRFSGIQALSQPNGSASIGSLLFILKFLFDYILIFDPSKYSVKLFYLLIISLCVILYTTWKVRNEQNEQINRKKYLSQILLGGLFFFSAVFYSTVSKNQPQIGFIQFFFFFAFICLANTNTTKYPFYFIFLILAFLIAREFHTNVNRTRMANDMMYEHSETKISLGYFDLKWKLPAIYEKKISYSDYNSFLNFSQKNPDNILYLGDMTILLGLSGKQSFFPALWFHTDLTIPSDKFKEHHEIFQSRIIENILKHKIKYIVFEGEMENFSEMCNLKVLDRLETFISKNEKERFKIGNLPAIRILD